LALDRLDKENKKIGGEDRLQKQGEKGKEDAKGEVIEKKIKGTRVKPPYRQAKNAKGDKVGGGISKKRGRRRLKKWLSNESPILEYKGLGSRG
jgi:hypothetical protein